jgi:hypothetical protein
MTPEEYLAIPYVLVVESLEASDGTWFRRARYPELDVSADAFSPMDAIDKLEEVRISTILNRIERGEAIPVPRPPLRDDPDTPERGRLDFARWLVQQRRVGS